MQPKLIEFNRLGGADLGYITVAESERNIPFPVRRVYWTYHTPDNVIRGGHAHKQLHQVIFAVNGKIEFTLTGKDLVPHTFLLDRPDIGLYIPKMYWRDIKFMDQAVLLCFASEYYDEADYIRDYDAFVNG